MRKTLSDMAMHLKNLIPTEIPDTYAINITFKDVKNEESIYEGVLAFRDFLYRLCDVLIADGDFYDNNKKITHAFDNRSSISVHYPFLHNVERLLSNIGLHGVLAEGSNFTISGNDMLNSKLSGLKNLECLRFLATCGICFDGIDLDEKKPDLSKIERIIISYPDNTAMLTGLKVMAIAQKEFWSNDNTDNLLRCDYRSLSNERLEAVSILKELIKPLSINIQNYVLKLHQRYLDKGLSCDIKIKDFWIKIYYSYKKREVWAVNTSLNNGYQISVKAENTHEYTDVVKSFPLYLQEMIARGYGCGKKRGISSNCDGGCRGLRISLDESILGITDEIETWFDDELSCLQGAGRKVNVQI